SPPHRISGLTGPLVTFILRPLAIRRCPVRIPIDLVYFEVTLRSRVTLFTYRYRISFYRVGSFHDVQLPFRYADHQTGFGWLRRGVFLVRRGSISTRTVHKYR